MDDNQEPSSEPAPHMPNDSKPVEAVVEAGLARKQQLQTFSNEWKEQLQPARHQGQIPQTGTMTTTREQFLQNKLACAENIETATYAVAGIGMVETLLTGLSSLSHSDHTSHSYLLAAGAVLSLILAGCATGARNKIELQIAKGPAPA